MKKHPWQHEWKRPKLELKDRKCCTEPVDVAAAILTSIEIEQSLSSIPKNDEESSLLSRITKSKETSLLLSITLFGGDQSNKLLLDLQGTSSKTNFLQRELHWPGFMIGEHNRIISIALCRRDKKSTSPSEADAVNVIDLMSLGGFDLDVNSSNIFDAKTVNTSGEENSYVTKDDAKSITTNTDDLVLVCLAKEKAYFYKVVDLLHFRTPINDNIELGLATLLLGNIVLEKVQQSLFPLSKPYATVELTISKNEVKWKNKLLPSGIFEREGSHIDPWDPSFWDATVEKSTTMYRTRNNEVLEVVSAFGYVAVIGRGRRVRRVRKNKKESVVIVEGIEALEEQQQDNHQGKEEVMHERWLQEENECERENDNIDPEKEGWWKESTGGDSDDEMVDAEEMGGFVTFIDLEHSSETRTLFLPFAPKGLYPIQWGGMAFAILLADESSEIDFLAKAMAIRIDASNKIKFRCGENPVKNNAKKNGTDNENSSCEVRRFQLIPIILPVEDQLSFATIRTLAASSIWCASPCIELLHSILDEESNKQDVVVTLSSLVSFDLMGGGDLPSYIFSSKPGKLNVVIHTMQRVGHVARIPSKVEDEHFENCWSQIFQGCSLLRINRYSYFICWDGATASEGAYVEELCHSDHMPSHNIRCVLLSSENMTKKPFSVLDEEEFSVSDKAESSIRLQNLPLTEPQTIANATDSNLSYPTFEVEQIVVDALDSISSLDYLGEESLFSAKEKPKLKRTERLSYAEKSARLVHGCESWATLDDNKENRAMFESQVPLSMSISEKQVCLFSLRSRFVKNGHATPFKQVLSWLSQAENFFTSTSIALGLLRDIESLNELKAQERFGYDEQGNKGIDLEALLDGIIPLYPQGSISLRPRPSIITEVADMAIGCLVKGGLLLATTLNFFLKKNKDYNHSSACLMLVSILTRCISRNKSVVEKAMGSGYKFSDKSEPEDLLWALRNLLDLGVARDYLGQVIFLVNASMPDELRCYQDKSDHLIPLSLEFCKTMISTILSSSAKAAPLLLSQVDENSRMRYWESLSHNVQLEFSLIRVREDSPLLREPEVRNWALECLDHCVRRETEPTATKVFQSMPTKWLQTLFVACLANGECDYDRLLACAIDDSDPGDDDEGATAYLAEFHKIVEGLSTPHKGGGLDFGLLIPALLILERRNCLCNEQAIISTRRVLDAVCYLAGSQETLSGYVFDGVRTMQQCATTNIVSAGAFLCGGENGLILNCCDVLIQETRIDMKLAETYVMSKDLPRDILSRRKDKIRHSFAITDGHKKTLWMICEHVLSIKTFGEFNPIHLRGKVDPVLAAQACLRTWVFLSPSRDSTAWLVNWLRTQLVMVDGGINAKRLPCAALTRALVWPTSEKSEETLAETMNMDSMFLVQLAQSCHGLIESIPTEAGEAIISRADSERGNSLSV